MSRLEEILDIVAEVSLVERSRLVPEVRISDLGITSLDMVEIIFALEDKLGIELPFNANTSAQGFRTLGDVIAVVEKTLAETGNS